MKKRNKKTNKSLVARPLVTTIVVLLVPLFALQFGSEFNWGVEDFIAIGLLVFSGSLAYEFLASKYKTTEQRRLIGLGLAVIVMLIWAELAVGIFS